MRWTCRFLRCNLHFLLHLLYSAVAIVSFGANATEGMEPTWHRNNFAVPYNMKIW